MTAQQVATLLRLTNTQTSAQMLDYLQLHHDGPQLISDLCVTAEEVAEADAEAAIKALSGELF